MVGFNHRFLAPSPSRPSPLPGTGRREMTFQFFFSTSCLLHTFSGPLAQTPPLTQKPPKQFWQKMSGFYDPTTVIQLFSLPYRSLCRNSAFVHITLVKLFTLSAVVCFFALKEHLFKTNKQTNLNQCTNDTFLDYIYIYKPSYNMREENVLVPPVTVIWGSDLQKRLFYASN